MKQTNNKMNVHEKINYRANFLYYYMPYGNDNRLSKIVYTINTK